MTLNLEQLQGDHPEVGKKYLLWNENTGWIVGTYKREGLWLCGLTGKERITASTRFMKIYRLPSEIPGWHTIDIGRASEINMAIGAL